MSKTNLDDQPIEFTCPDCGHKIKKTIGWLKNKGNTCPGCGILFDSKEFTRRIQELEKQLDDFGGDSTSITLKF